MSFFTGFNYLFRGMQLLTTPGLRTFVWVPFIVNLLLFGGVFWFLLGEVEQWQQVVNDFLPSWLQWLSGFLLPLIIVTMALFVYFLFTTLANWILAPFNGLLSEKVEHYLTQQSAPPTSALSLLKDVPRVLSREFQKLVYFIPRFFVFALLFFVLPVFGQLLWFCFTAWVLAIQFSDYPFDNHKIPFASMRRVLSQNPSMAFGFGTAIALLTFIPIINFIVMPAAVCGSTVMWVESLKDKSDAN